MAANQSGASAPKPSFASIAAMAPPLPAGKPARTRREIQISPATPQVPAQRSTRAISETSSTVPLRQDLASSMSRLAITGNTTKFETKETYLPRSEPLSENRPILAPSTAPRTADMGAKSFASRITFSMDEKESLRPDDSASIIAYEELDSNTALTPSYRNPGTGSDTAARAFRDQFREISESIGPVSIPVPTFPILRRAIPSMSVDSKQGILPTQSVRVSSPVAIPENIGTVIQQPNGNTFEYPYQEPDEKLFEALESPKDRLFILRLEQEIISFVRDSREPTFDLPPCNSFCRLLTHKLADYYALTHYVDNAISSVKLYRTPYCRLPTPLSAISRPIVPKDDAAQSQPTMKIMRRAETGKDGQASDSGANTAANSIIPSKAGSEADDASNTGTGFVSPTESEITKEKTATTREEREAKYKLARERIFKGFDDTDKSENISRTSTSNQVSRASSTEKKRNRKRHNHNDDFEARSQFNAYYPGMQIPSIAYAQAADTTSFFNPYMPHLSTSNSQPRTFSPHSSQMQYPQGCQAMSSSNGSGIGSQQSNISATNGFYSQGNASSIFSGYDQQTPTQYFQAMQHSSSGFSSPAMTNNGFASQQYTQWPEQQWPQPWNKYQPTDSQQMSAEYQNQSKISTSGMCSTPYPYGELPYQSMSQVGRPQHPLPGSYSRPGFNPRTNSFVPQTHLGPPTLASYGTRPGQSSPAVSSMAFQYGSQGFPYDQQLPSYAQSSSLSSLPMPPVSTAHNNGFDTKSFGLRKGSSLPAPSQPTGQNLISKYGVPSHLPPKPPPSEIPSIPTPEVQHPLPPTVRSMGNLQATGHGQGMPTYQNGIYFHPSSCA